jgi:hypothetical protein
MAGAVTAGTASTPSPGGDRTRLSSCTSDE